MSNPYIHEMRNFKKSVELRKFNKNRLTSIGETKHSIDLSGFKRKSYCFSTHVLGNAEAPKKIQTKSNLKARSLFRKVFIQIRVIIILTSEKSLIERIEKSFRTLGLIQESNITLRSKIQDNLYSINEDGMNKYHRIVDKYLKERENTPLYSKKKYVIYSDMLFKKILDACMIIVLVFVSIYYPYKISFLYNEKFEVDVLFILDTFVDCFFVVDLVASFFTAYNYKGVLKDDLCDIVNNYLTGWFIIDLITIFPFFIIDLYYQNNNTGFDALNDRNNRTKSLLGFFKILRILKVSKIFKDNPFFDRTLYLLKFKSNFKKILVNFLFLIITLHFVACFFYYISTFDSYRETWVDHFGYLDSDKVTLYINAFYFSIVTAFSVGYGDIYAVNQKEQIFVIVFLLIGIAIYSYSLSKMISLFEEISTKDNFIREKENSVKEFCRNHSLPRSLYHEIRNYLLDNDSKQNSYFSYDKVVQDFRDLTQGLPFELNQKIYYDIFKHKLKLIPLFSEVKSEKFMVFLCSLIDIKYMNMNEIVYKPGDIAKEIYVVFKGEVIMYNSLLIKNFEEYCLKKIPSFTIKTKRTNVERRLYSQEKSKVMTYFSLYDVFGENDIWKNDGMTRKFTVKAKLNSVLVMLRKSDIKFLFEIDPNFKKRLEEIRVQKETVIKFILDVKTSKKNLIEQYQNFLKTKDRKIIDIIGVYDYKSLTKLISNDDIKKLKNHFVMKKNISKSNKNLPNLSLFYSKYRISLPMLNQNTDIEATKKIIEMFHQPQRKQSSLEFQPKINLINFSSKIKQEKEEEECFEDFNMEITKLLNNKKFNIMTSDIYPIIYNINFLMKKVFTLMKCTTYQFEEVRRVLSKHTLDEIHSANYSITESFSVFYELAEDLNKINNMNFNFKVKTFLEKYADYVDALEKRINLCSNNYDEDDLKARSNKTMFDFKLVKKKKNRGNSKNDTGNLSKNSKVCCKDYNDCINNGDNKVKNDKCKEGCDKDDLKKRRSSFLSVRGQKIRNRYEVSDLNCELNKN